MKISTTIIAALGMAALAACGSNADNSAATNTDANLDASMGTTTDNMGMTTDPNMTMDANMTGNGSINAADGMNSTENAMSNDLNSNDADTNLANGM